MTKFLRPSFIVSFLFLAYLSFSQDKIHNIPNTFAVLTKEEIKDQFEYWHDFSEEIHANRKLKTTITHLPNDNLFSEERWPVGSWGNGYFSDNVHHRTGPIPNWGGSSYNLYNNWYNENINNRGEEIYFSAHPLPWHSAGRIIGYIHAYQYTAKEIYLTRVKQGLQYLINDQNDSGGYNYYEKRSSKNNTSNYQLVESWVHGLDATRALSEGYMFLNSLGDHSMNYDLWQAMNKAGEYLINKNDQVDFQPINARSWYTWALVGLYKATGKAEYLTLAQNKTKAYFNYQENDGSWTTPNPRVGDEYHDSYLVYHGIILRGLNEIYKLTTQDPVLKDQLKDAIDKTINHVIDYNGVPNPVTSSRLYGDTGFMENYHYLDTIRYSTVGDDGSIKITIATPSVLLYGLIATLKNVDYSLNDKEKINQLIYAGFKAMIAERRIHKVPHHNMMSLGLFLINDLQSYNLSWAGTIRTNNSNFDTMTSVDFNNDGIEELAFYDFENKLFNVYEKNNYTPVFSQNTNNGALFNLMSSGDYDNDGIEELSFYRSSYSDGLVAVRNPNYGFNGLIKTYNDNFNMMVSGNYNSDDNDEIAFYNEKTEEFKVYKNYQNTPIYSGYTTVENGPKFNLITSGDYDGDGQDEIALYRNYEGLISIQSSELNFKGSIKTKNTDFDMISTINHQGAKIAFYDRENKLFSFYKRGSDQPLFSRHTTNGTMFDLMTTGNFDSDPEDEIALYRKSDGIVTILNIDGFVSNKNLNSRSNNQKIEIVNNNNRNELKIKKINKNNISIVFDLNQESTIKLQLNDLQGREIVQFSDDFLPKGKQEKSFEIKSISSGIYILSVLINKEKQVFKIYLK